MISSLSLIDLWISCCLYIIFHNSWSHQLFRQAFRRNSLKTSFSDRNSNGNSLSTPMVFFSLFGWNYVQKYIIYKNSWRIQMEIPSEIQMFFCFSIPGNSCRFLNSEFPMLLELIKTWWKPVLSLFSNVPWSLSMERT